jgi:hypothetical protein
MGHDRRRFLKDIAALFVRVPELAGKIENPIDRRIGRTAGAGESRGSR